jgi:hypothetical protein
MGAEEAKARNFADEILFQLADQPAAAVTGVDMSAVTDTTVVVMLTTTQAVKMKEALKAEKTVKAQQETAALNLLRQKLNYLELKGVNQ